MISYQLKCSSEHSFEAWFKSSADFDKLLSAGLVECPQCGTNDVSKSLMAPGVRTKGKGDVEKSHAIASAIEKMRAELRSAKNVGWRFANEARAMHYGDKEASQIYGKSEPEDVKALLDEGIGVLPLPFDPDAKTN